MGNAIDEVKDGSCYVTAQNDEDGVALAIGCLLDGDVSKMRTNNRAGV